MKQDNTQRCISNYCSQIVTGNNIPLYFFYLMIMVFKVLKIRKTFSLPNMAWYQKAYEYNPMLGISFTFYHDFHYFIIALNSSNCINCEKRRWAVHKNRLSEHDNESCKLNVIPCLCLCRLLNNIPFPVIFINMNKRMGQFFLM